MSCVSVWGFIFGSRAAVPQDLILALSLAACQQNCLGVSVGNWLKTNFHPTASLAHGVAAPQRLQQGPKGLVAGSMGAWVAEAGFNRDFPKYFIWNLCKVVVERVQIFHVSSQMFPDSSCTDPKEGWVNCATEHGHFTLLIPCQIVLFNTV